MSEQQVLQQDGKRFEEAIDELDKSLSTSEGELARNPLKQRSLQLQVSLCRSIVADNNVLWVQERQVTTC